MTEGTGEERRESGGTGSRALVLFARVLAWLTVVLYAAGVLSAFWLERRLGLQDENPLEGMMLQVGFGTFAVVGALLVAKRPTNLIGWIMAVIALMAGVFHVGDVYAAYVLTTRGQPDALAILGAWVQGWYWFPLLALTVIYLPLLFPDGRLPSRRWIPVAVLPAIGTLGAVVLGALSETLRGQEVDYRIDNPIGIDGLGYAEDLPVFGMMWVLLAIGIIGAVASVVVRFRRSRGIERQQMKWFLYATVLLPVFLVLDYLPDIIDDTVGVGVFVALPAAVGIAVLRYRLYDIDVLINRTLVYGSLTVALLLVYFGGIVALQRLFVALTGQRSTLAIVASTLLIAALFTPLRRRIQSFIDRRFYRRKYDARRTLEAFSTKLRDETDLEALNNELVGVMRETIQPAHVSVWLRPDTSSKGQHAD